MLQMSAKGKALLATWEGIRTHVYMDSGGEPTLGIGHRLTRSERASGKLFLDGQPVRYANGLTEAQCYALLAQDLAPIEHAIFLALQVSLKQCECDALCSFVLNVGITAFEHSTLLRLLNQGDYDAVPGQLRRWVHDNGQRVPGLINRREHEVALWEGHL